MDYKTHYDNLISRAKDRKLDGYVERHHVIPKCLGGDDSDGNIAILTPEEHFIAHQLLVRLFPENKKLVYAAWAMTAGKWRNNKKFGWLRRARSAAQIGVKHSEEAKRKISASAKGRKLSHEQNEALIASRVGKMWTEEHRKNLSNALKGKPKSEAHKIALSIARKNMVYTDELRKKLGANKGKKLNDAQKAALLAATVGKSLSEDHKKKISCANKGKIRKIVQCNYCGKSGGAGIMNRWHFENCKAKNG